MDIAMIWGLNHVGDKNSFNNVANQLNWNWGTCASIACSRLASPEMLERIRSHCQPFVELGYVLWLISENPNATKETITSIAKDLPLGFWSVAAKRSLSDGYGPPYFLAILLSTNILYLLFIFLPNL